MATTILRVLYKSYDCESGTEALEAVEKLDKIMAGLGWQQVQWTFGFAEMFDRDGNVDWEDGEEDE